jgi:PAS domain S-box-containing protein
MGWILGWPVLVTIVPGQPSMKPNTALAVLLIGIAGALRQRDITGSPARTIANLAALVVLVIGVGTLFEYALATDLGIDPLLLRAFAREDEAPYPGRPSPPTAFALSLLAVALLVFDRARAARARPAELLILCSLFVAFGAGVGFLFGAGPLYRLRDAPVTGVSLPTATSLVLVCIGLLLHRPDLGIMRVVMSRGPGGVMLRRLAIPAVLAPVVLGPVLTRVLADLGVEDYPLVLAVLSIAMTAVALLLLTVSAPILNRTHDALEASRQRVRELIEHAPDGVFLADLDGRYVDANEAGCRMLGCERVDIVGQTIVDLIPPGGAERLARERERLLAGDLVVSEWALRRKDGRFVPVEVSARILPDGRWQGFVRDISERKTAQEQLRQSQDRLELALRGADLAAWDWNVKTGEVIFNRGWAEMRGFRAEEIRPHVDSWIAGVHPDDWPHVQRVLAEHLAGRLPEYETEHRVRTKSGEWLWILDRGKVFARDEDGQPARMVGTELDITARKRLDLELRLALARSSGILSISADAIICIDASQRITMFNRGAEEIFGYSAAELLGQPLERLIPERFRAVHREHVDRFAAGAEAARRMGERRTEIAALRKSGEEFPADASISKLDVDGQTILTVVVRDVTEHKRRESEQRLLGDVASTLAATLDYEATLQNIARLVVKDLADICIVETVEEDGRVGRPTNAHRDPRAAPIAAALGGVPLGLPGGLRTPLLVSKVGEKDPDSLAIDEERRRALQELGIESLLVLPLSTHGQALGILVLASTKPGRWFGPGDVPLAEEVAHRAASAVDSARLYRMAVNATRSRDELLAIVAHDLRNPLTALLVELSLMRRRGEPERRSMAGVERIARSAHRINRLIDDLLDVTRIEAGRLTVECAAVPVSQVLHDCVQTQKPLASEASLEIRLQAEAELPDVWADDNRLQQVLENLVGNAVKFSEPGGVITLGAMRVAGAVRFSVSDTGSGIPGDELPYVFDRFWQAGRRDRPGAGLGLAIVKGIVEAHGGSIRAESEPGHGSTFSFTIPVVSADVPRPSGRCQS